MVTNETLELKTLVSTLDKVQGQLSSHQNLSHEIISVLENTLAKHGRATA